MLILPQINTSIDSIDFTGGGLVIQPYLESNLQSIKNSIKAVPEAILRAIDSISFGAFQTVLTILKNVVCCHLVGALQKP